MFRRLTNKEILAIIKTVNECKNIALVDITVGDIRVIIKGSSNNQQIIPESSKTKEGKQEVKIEEKKVTAVQTEVKEDENLIPIKSPMVGTFYRAPSPSAKPYVEIGQVIAAGQPLCIIEAMKLMNEIESEVPGRVVKILVENGKPVEFGQTLFQIEPL